MKRGRKVRRSKPAPRNKRSSAAKRSAAAKKGWETRRRKALKRKPSKRKKATPKRKSLPLKKISRALRSAKKVFEAQGFAHDLPGWQPAGGWQGDAVAEEISYMTHEEKLEWLEWLAEQLDTTISELFEMMGSP